MRLILGLLFISCSFLAVKATNRTESPGDDSGGEEIAVANNDPVIKFKSDGKSESESADDRLEKSDRYFEEYDYVDGSESVDNLIGEKSKDRKDGGAEELNESGENFPNEVFLSLRNLSGTENSAFRGFTQKNDLEDLQASASDGIEVSVKEADTSSDPSSIGNLRTLRGVGQLSYGAEQDEIYPPFNRPPNTIDNADFSDCARQGEWKPIAVDGSPINLEDESDHHHGFQHGHYQHQFGAASEIQQSVGSFPGTNKIIPHWHDNYLSSSDNQASFPPGNGGFTYGASGSGSGANNGVGHIGGLKGVGGVKPGGVYSGFGSNAPANDEYLKIKSSSMLSPPPPPPPPPIIFGKRPVPWKSHKSKHKFNFDNKWKRPGGFSSNPGLNFGAVSGSVGHGGSFGDGGTFSSGPIKSGSKGGNFGGRPIRYFKGGNGKYSGNAIVSGHLKQGSGGFGNSGFREGNLFSDNFKHGSGNTIEGYSIVPPTVANLIKPQTFDGSQLEANANPTFFNHFNNFNGGFDGSDLTVFTGHKENAVTGEGNGDGSGNTSLYSEDLKQSEEDLKSGIKDTSGFSEQLAGGGGEFNSASNGYSEHSSLDNSASHTSSSGYSEHLASATENGESLFHGNLRGAPLIYYTQNIGNAGPLGILPFGNGGSEYGFLAEYSHNSGDDNKIPSSYVLFDSGNSGFNNQVVTSEANYADSGKLAVNSDQHSGAEAGEFSNEINNNGYSSDSNYSNEDSKTEDSPDLSDSNSGSSSLKTVFDETLSDNTALHSANIVQYEGEKDNSAVSLSHENSIEENGGAHLNGNDINVPQAESVDLVHSTLVSTTNLESDEKESGGSSGHAEHLGFPGGYLGFGSPGLISDSHAQINSGESAGAYLQTAPANLVATAVPVGAEKGAATFSAENLLAASSAPGADHLGGKVVEAGSAGGLVLETGLPQTPLLTSYLNLQEIGQGTLNSDSTPLSTQILQATREGNSISDSFLSNPSQEYSGFDLQTHGSLDDSSTFTCGKNHYQNTKYHTATFQVADTDHSGSVDIIKYDGDAAVIVQANRAPFTNDDYLKTKSFDSRDDVRVDGSKVLNTWTEPEENALKFSGKFHSNIDSSITNNQFSMNSRKPQTFTSESEEGDNKAKPNGPQAIGPLSDVKVHGNAPRPQIFDGLQSGGNDLPGKNVFRFGYKKNHPKYPLRPGKVHFYQKNLKNLKPPFRYGSQGGRDTRGERPISVRDVSSPRPIPLQYFPNSKPYGFPRPRIGGPFVVKRPDKNTQKIVRVVRS